MTSSTPPTAAPQPKSRRREATTSPPKPPARPRADPAAVVLAAIAGAHGVGGEVRLKLFTDDLAVYRSFNDGALTLAAFRAPGIARFAEVSDRNTAEAMRGTLLTVPRAALPPLDEGEYYHADLIGLSVSTDAGDAVGTVAAVENFGAGDILDIEKPGGKRFMVPVAVATIGDAVTIPSAFRD